MNTVDAWQTLDDKMGENRRGKNIQEIVREEGGLTHGMGEVFRENSFFGVQKSTIQFRSVFVSNFQWWG